MRMTLSGLHDGVGGRRSTVELLTALEQSVPDNLFGQLGGAGEAGLPGLHCVHVPPQCCTLIT
jgi:hypothetical protein